MKVLNEMEMTFDALSVNEGFARVCVASFCVQLNPSLDEITDIKTAVSEAVTNAVVHAYPNRTGCVTLKVQILPENEIVIEVKDSGVGISDFEKAREPFFTTRSTEERSGMGFTVMESFMDKLELSKNGAGGVKVVMYKKIGRSYAKTKAAND